MYIKTYRWNISQTFVYESETKRCTVSFMPVKWLETVPKTCNSMAPTFQLQLLPFMWCLSLFYTLDIKQSRAPVHLPGNICSDCKVMPYSSWHSMLRPSMQAPSEKYGLKSDDATFSNCVFALCVKYGVSQHIRDF